MMTERLDSSQCVEGDDVFHDISQVHPHNLSLLLSVAQSTGRPLPVGSYTERTVMQMIDRVVVVQTLSVTIVNKREAVVELKDDDPIIDVSQLIQGLGILGRAVC